MGSDSFPEKPLGELVEVYDSLRKPVKSSDRRVGPYPYYGASGITDYVDDFIFDGEYLLLSEDGDNLRSQNTPIAFLANGKFWVNNHAHILQGNSGNNTKFLCYALQVADITSYLSGSTRPKLNQKDMRRILVKTPPLPEQKAIAHILRSLDDKIELNRRMNAMLEQIARALFKSWFVDFDPVIDNALAAGHLIPEELAERAQVRSQALANGTANRQAAKHFPAAFQLTEEMGWIPEGWEASTIDDETETVGGGTPSTKNPDFWEDGEFPWVTPKDFSSLQDKVLLSSSRYLTREGLNKVSAGLLPKGTVLMSSRAPVGYLAITQIETAINQGFIAMKCNGRLPSEYILQWANSIMDDIKQVSSGSTFAEISKKAFRPFKILAPMRDPLDAYTDLVAPTYARITDNVAETETLSSLRDTLLPRLISGELRLNA